MMASDKRRTSPEYWEARLKRMNLEVDRGRPSWLDYGHEVSKLDTDGRKTFEGEKAGESLEYGEWPISL